MVASGILRNYDWAIFTLVATDEHRERIGKRYTQTDSQTEKAARW